MELDIVLYAICRCKNLSYNLIHDVRICTAKKCHLLQIGYDKMMSAIAVTAKIIFTSFFGMSSSCPIA